MARLLMKILLCLKHVYPEIQDEIESIAFNTTGVRQGRPSPPAPAPMPALQFAEFMDRVKAVQSSTPSRVPRMQAYVEVRPESIKATRSGRNVIVQSCQWGIFQPCS